MNDAPAHLESWFSPGRFALLTGCLIFACFPGVILGRETFFFRDFAIFSYPLAAYHKECFWRGEIPLWNPYNACGLPFLAQWNTMVFYPLSLIYLLLPLAWSLSFFCLFHLWLGGIGMYFLARSWTGGNFAGALAGLGFIFGGVVLSCLKWPNNIAALGWMPWVILAAERALHGGRRALATAVLAGAAQMLAGAPEIIVLTWGLAGALTLGQIVSEPAKGPVRAGKFALLIVLVAGLSAVQLLPFIDLLLHSQRDSGFRGSQWPMPPWGWANFILPLYKMFPSYHDVHAQPGQYWISTYYVSIGIVLLALIALAKARSPKVWLLGGLLLFSMWMALGDRAGLYKLLRASVPGLGMMRFPIKFIVLAAFVLPLLGGIGLNYLLSRRDGVRKRVIWIPAGILIGMIGALVFYSELNPFGYSRAFLTTWNGLWRAVFLALFAGTLVAAMRGSGFRTAAAGLFLLILTVADALTHTTWQNPAAPRWVYDGTAAEMRPKPVLGEGRVMMSPEAAETVDHLKLDTPAEDVMASRASLYCNLNLLERIPKVDGFYAIYPRAMGQLQERIYTGTNLPPAGLLDFLGVTQLTAPGTWDRWEHRPGALPLITSPPELRPAHDPLGASLSPDFDPRAHALVETNTLSATGGATASIDSIEWQPQRITFRASAPAGAAVVISQSYYHRWQASINGERTELWRVNGAFQGLRIPPGSHQVVLEYRDAPFRSGAVASVISGAAVLALLLVPAGLKRVSKTDGSGIAL